MSGQPTGNASSGSRPATNGIPSGSMAASQPRPNDPQIGSSNASNGQPSSTSQSNLNQIVRRNLLDFGVFTRFAPFGLCGISLLMDYLFLYLFLVILLTVVP